MPGFIAEGATVITTISFERKSRELKLGVERIASVHGRTTSSDELQRAMQSTNPSI